MNRRLVVVAGYAGSGKTEFAKGLALRTGWALLDKDTLTRALVEVAARMCCGDPHDRHTETYLSRVRPVEYSCLMSTAWEVIDYGCSAIVAAPFLAEVASAMWMADLLWRCELQDIDLKVVWVHADLTSMRERLSRRGAERDSWKLRCWDTYAAGVDLALRPAGAHLLIENTLDNVATLADQADAFGVRLTEGS